MVGKFLQGKIFHKETETKDLVHVERLGKAFSQISSAINTHKDLKTILEAAAREVLNCLKAQRSTIFFRNEKGDGLNPHLTFASDQALEQVCVNQEKEIAQKALQQNKPFVLRKPEDFSEFSRTKRTEQKITSLMSVPISSGDRPMGVLSAAVFNGHSFGLQSLQFFSIFANHVSIALEMARMHEDLRKAKGVQQAYHRKMDEIVTQVQNLSLQDRQNLEEHIVILQETPEADGDRILQGQTGDKIPWVRGDILLLQNSGVDHAEEANVSVQVEFRDDYWKPTENLNQGKEGAFIQIADPLELGDQFPMMLYMPNGGEPIEVQCKVTWTNKYGKVTKDMGKGMAVKFLTLQPEDKKKIDEFVQKEKKKFELSGFHN
jgi:Tfp pilus assembly protein PilZ